MDNLIQGPKDIGAEMNTEDRIKELMRNMAGRVTWNEQGRTYVEEMIRRLATDILTERRVEVLMECGIIQLHRESICALQILSVTLPEMQDKSFTVMQGMKEIGRVYYSGEQVKLGPQPGNIFIGQGVKFVQNEKPRRTWNKSMRRGGAEWDI